MLQSEQLLSGRSPSRWAYALCYALYAVVLLLCYQSFWIWRTTVEVVVGYLYRKHEWFQFIYLVLTLLTGLVFFMIVAVSEPYLRHAIEVPARAAAAQGGPLRRLAVRFGRVAGGLVLGLLIAAVLQELVFRRAGV
jgi:hypothetical protein